MWTAELSPYSRYREATLVVEPAIVALDRDGLPLDCATKACAGDGVKDDVIHGQRLHQRQSTPGFAALGYAKVAVN